MWGLMDMVPVCTLHGVVRPPACAMSDWQLAHPATLDPSSSQAHAQAPFPADWRARLSPDPAAGAWVALGKFDALHRGHAALAAWAAARPGVPWLISFSGMAAVLGWRERLPLVAPGDRARILSAWGKEFGVTPRELRIPFAEVRDAMQTWSCRGMQAAQGSWDGRKGPHV